MGRQIQRQTQNINIEINISEFCYFFFYLMVSASFGLVLISLFYMACCSQLTITAFYVDLRADREVLVAKSDVFGSLYFMISKLLCK